MHRVILAVGFLLVGGCYDPLKQHPNSLPFSPATFEVGASASTSDYVVPMIAGGVVTVDEFFMSRSEPPHHCDGVLFMSNETGFRFEVAAPLDGLTFELDPAADTARMNLVVDAPGEPVRCFQGLAGKPTGLNAPSPGRYDVWIAYKPGLFARLIGGDGLFAKATLHIRALPRT